MLLQRGLVAGAVVALFVSLTAGCQATDSAEVRVVDAWIKATDESMTGMFASVENQGSSDVTIVGAETEVAGMVEIHEVVGGVMREKEGGRAIAAGETAVLEPGGDHIMLMGLNRALLPGETITVTIFLGGGDSVEVAAQVRDFAGADEEYVPKDMGESAEHGEMGE